MIDQMLKYTTALRLGTAETEAICGASPRRTCSTQPTRPLPNWARPSRIFLCRYLHSEACAERSIEGLNVVEQWNGATDFVFFARRGEMVSNRQEDHEISMLALHLIQNCMVYVNTLMIHKVLAQPHWQGKLTPRDWLSCDR
jgi:TnpA family transposase